ncbi:hypothetical protein MKK69_00890 [Methylobacterium sp. J-026]|uniref:hypothetical protein n=1 Tax=Methylobacterium sp. J-026 TaxID=2836624 RepID=UPI001FBAFDC5|nr:hypothetical protein [Methylobacterium sp. J-026]MCJ2132638.1 hypothetical protein [Methylobacterium sp. J-026]
MALRCSHGPNQRPASSADSARTEHTLACLAKALDVPLASFFPDKDRQDEAVRQAADLVTVFAGIENAAARRTCLAFVRAMASS